MKEQLGNVPEAVSVGVGHCCVARCRGADARNISCRIPDRKFTANSGLRPGCSVGVAASRRATAPSRRFWLLVGCGLAVWGLANAGWMYYEIVLHTEPPTGSVVRFLFGTQSIFFALAVFLNQDKDASTLDLESV